MQQQCEAVTKIRRRGKCLTFLRHTNMVYWSHIVSQLPFEYGNPQMHLLKGSTLLKLLAIQSFFRFIALPQKRRIGFQPWRVKLQTDFL